MTLVETILQELEEAAARTANEASELREKGEYGAANIMEVWSDAYLQSANIVRSAERLYVQAESQVPEVVFDEPEWLNVR